MIANTEDVLMRYFVTGGAGFIGSHFVRRAIDSGHSVLNLDKLTYCADLNRLQDLQDNDLYQFVQGDICDARLVHDLFSTFKPDVLVNFAAETHVDRSIDAPDHFINTNVVGTAQLLKAALQYYRDISADRKSRFRFVHISTDEVYGDLAPNDPAFTTQSQYRPSSPYSASKASADHLVRAWFRTYGLPTIVTNCSNNYGPCQFQEKLIPFMVMSALSGKVLPVYGHGSNIRDWIYVEDHVNAVMTVLQNGDPGQTYMIGGDNEQKNIDVVKDICGLLDMLVPRPDHHKYEEQIEFVQDRPGHDERYAIDNSAIRSELGWEPSYSWKDGLQKTVEWYVENMKNLQSEGQCDLVRIGLGK